jgi:signal transduction histidine kinase
MEGARLAQLRVPYQAVVLSEGALKDLAAQLEVALGSNKEGLLCPLEVEGHPMGFFFLSHPPTVTWKDGDVDRAILLCGPLAQALENSRFHRQLAKFSDESLAVAYEKLKAAYEELQHMQTQLLDTEKLNVVGKLASSVAHQLRNPLGVIKASAQLLLTKLKPEGLMKERLEAIHRNSMHADNIITELLQIARPRPTGPLEPLPVHDVLNEAVKMVEAKVLDAGITLKKQYGELPSVMGSTHHLQQVFMNFLMNSVEAMPDKGSITMTGRSEGAQLTLVFEDTGEGFTPEALQNLAHPFFTTKPHGVGLGMYAAKQILEAHRGTMHVESTLGKGTRITVTFPIASSISLPKG